MVIVHLTGGFGNQMFCYAFGRAVASFRNDVLAIDTAMQDADWFFRDMDLLEMEVPYDKRISYPVGRRLIDRGFLNKWNHYRCVGWTTKEITEKKVDELTVWSKEFKEYIAKPKNLILKGNWGKEVYFKPAADKIKECYVFRKPLSAGALQVQEEIRAVRGSVTIHYRRGDYVRVGACPSPQYFLDAMEAVAKKVQNPVFFCFSEEIEWVKEQFAGSPYDIRYPEYESDKKGIEDFRLLMEGENQIISNSSYSWWAAYLNRHENKTVVVPTNGSMWPEDFGLSEWIKIPMKLLEKEN